MIPISALMSPLLGLVRPAAARIGNDLWRRWKIDRRFVAGTPSTDSPIIRTAISDLQVLIGKNGLLTESLNNFLVELQATGLLISIAKNAFFRGNNTGVRLQFELMYSRHFNEIAVDGEQSNCDKLYDTICFFLRESILEQVSADFSFIAQHSPELFRGRTFDDIRNFSKPEMLDSVGLVAEPYIVFDDSSQNRISGLSRASYPSWLYLDPKHISNLLRIVAEALIPYYEKVRLDGPAQRSFFCEIDKLYVPASLTAAEHSVVDFDFRVPRATALSISDALENAAYSAVLGDPGGGKSTLAQRLCLDALRKCAKDGQSSLAVRVEIRRFNQVPGLPAADTLRDFITNEMRRQANLSRTEINLSELIDHLLFYGRLLVIFDGLDEIINVARRTDIIATITAFARRFQHNQFICTCRKVDFFVTPIPNIAILLLDAFDIEDVKAYFRSASRYVFGKSDDEIESEEQDFIGRAIKNANEFIKNPLAIRFNCLDL
jgi:NACHT domain